MHADRHTLNELGFIGIVFSPPGFLLPSIQSTETRWEMGCSLDWAIFLVIKVRERKLYSHSGEQLSTHPSVNTDRYIHMCAFFPSNKSDQSLDQKIFHKIIFHVVLIAVPLRVQTFRCSPGPGVWLLEKPIKALAVRHKTLKGERETPRPPKVPTKTMELFMAKPGNRNKKGKVS